LIELATHATQKPSWYIPALQSVFLIAPVLLAPWVGGFADHYPKSTILMLANLLKALGTGLILWQIEPLIAYCVIGAGAAVYAPAKYGILPELAEADLLVKANSWIEGSTIFAILLGPIIGAKIAALSVDLALNITLILFIISAITTLSLPHFPSLQPKNQQPRVIQFAGQIRQFFIPPRARFVILGTSLFWATAATVRVIIVAWVPAVLSLHAATDIAEISLFLAVGIIVGAAAVPQLIPLNALHRSRIPAYLMALLIVALSLSHALLSARIILFLIGLCGGMFIVPINAALQEIGQHSIGSGSAVALQGFFENLAMLLAVGSYTYATWHYQLDPINALLGLGSIVFIATALISRHLPLTAKSSFL
jgi:LPLT family lysophospholipid transporter-like MFS transporter